MSRNLQLGKELCDQDRKILDLFKNESVKYIGNDVEFQQRLSCSDTASNLVLILNQSMWCSDIIKTCRQNLVPPINKFYIGINRYIILGNDTNTNIKITQQHGQDIVDWLTLIVSDLGYRVIEHGTFDSDMGRHFNFIQPLTWIYGSKTTN